MKYGVLCVQMRDGKFRRRWVITPDRRRVEFDSLDAAHDHAERMVTAAREEGILGVGYRARAVS